MNDQNEKITSFERLAPFMLRSRVVEIGRQRLEQVRKQLAFVLVTDDIAENSRKKALQLFPCPVFQCFSSHDLERFFGCHSTKMLGFRRSPLSSNAMKELKMYKITEDSLHKNPLPERPRVAILGASGIGRHHANWWHLEGAEVCAFLAFMSSVPAGSNGLKSSGIGDPGSGGCDCGAFGGSTGFGSGGFTDSAGCGAGSDLDAACVGVVGAVAAAVSGTGSEMFVLDDSSMWPAGSSMN